MAIAHDWDGARLDGRAVLWSSSNSDIAAVAMDGTVTGIAPGSALISASTGGKAATADITVTHQIFSPAAQPQGPTSRATLHPKTSAKSAAATTAGTGKAKPARRPPLPRASRGA
jgi:uncharacterized protein YjdB